MTSSNDSFDWQTLIAPSQKTSPLSQRLWSALQTWERSTLQPKSIDSGSVERMAWQETRWHNRKLELVSLIRYLETKEERKPEL